MSCTLKFGSLAALQDIPAPQNGMGFASNRDSEVTELLSGGRSVYSAPTTYKTFSMEWKGGTEGLQPLQDTFEGQYGTGPYYMYDPRYSGDNLLPARWAASYQLAHVANGWANPQIVESISGTLKMAQFTVLSNDTATPRTSPNMMLRTIAEPGKPLYLKVWGFATGGASIKWEGNDPTGTSLATGTLVPVSGGTSAQIALADHKWTYVRLIVSVPPGGSITLSHMDLSATNPADVCPFNSYRSGKGVGAVEFSSPLSGNIIQGTAGRIGLSLDLTEVETYQRT